MTKYIESDVLSLYEPMPEVKNILELIEPNNLPNRQRMVAVLTMLINEGRGKNYKYFVEEMDDGRKLFLKRPGPRRWGFDFTVNLEEFPDNPPSHDQMYAIYYLKKKGYLFSTGESSLKGKLNRGSVPDKLERKFDEEDHQLSKNAFISVEKKDKKWKISDNNSYIIEREDRYLFTTKRKRGIKGVFNQIKENLNQGKFHKKLEGLFERKGHSISDVSISVEDKGKKWKATEEGDTYVIEKHEDKNYLFIYEKGGKLSIYREENEDSFKELEKALEEVYEGNNPNKVYKKYAPFDFKRSLEVEAFLKTVTWLFIEQDIRYWFGDGRARTKGGFDYFSPDKAATKKKVLEEYKNFIEKGLFST